MARLGNSSHAMGWDQSFLEIINFPYWLSIPTGERFFEPFHDC
jgi:hypothetical protein